MRVKGEKRRPRDTFSHDVRRAATGCQFFNSYSLYKNIQSIRSIDPYVKRATAASFGLKFNLLVQKMTV